MGPWSKPLNVKTQRSATLAPAEWALMVGLAALVILGAAAIWCSRYEIGVAAGVPARLDRFTGQVITCVPGQGCLELIPAGEPTLRPAMVRRIPSGAPTPEASGAAAPAQPPSQPATPAPATPKPHG